ncbi:uncharacterized, partial [Tachysurus ichikawai]
MGQVLQQVLQTRPHQQEVAAAQEPARKMATAPEPARKMAAAPEPARKIGVFPSSLPLWFLISGPDRGLFGVALGPSARLWIQNHGQHC